MTPLFALCAAIVALVIVVPFGRAFADDCPTEKRKVCVQETIAGHTFTHEANTNECLVAKWSSSAKILHDGDCGSH
jgi:hypothetical protein